ncbi:MAG: glutathione S-transferase [Pseudomonadota bacterium]
MDRPVLYSFRRCPYAMRARMALYVSGCAVELREVVLKNKPAEMVAISPKATVPVLLLQNGDVLEESLDVMRWALAQNDPHQWLSGDQPTSEALISENDGPFKVNLDRYKYATRYEDADPAEHREKGSEFLFYLNERLAKQPALCGNDDTLPDIAIFPFVRQFRIADEEWFDRQPWSALHVWLSRHMNGTLFKSVMQKFHPWQSGMRGIDFP